MEKQKMLVSVSGGMTSGYMAYLMRDTGFDLEFVFANTGFEHEETLVFVDRMAGEFGIEITWLEAVVHQERKACTHKVVDFFTASRNGEPFEAVMRKYGLCNTSYPHCNRELKLHPIHDYAKSVLGWKKGEYQTAIGIRTDEAGRRANNKTVKQWGLTYPLLDWFPTDNYDIEEFWDRQDFKLYIEPYQGNCQMCFKKSEKKLVRMVQSNPEVATRYQQIENDTCAINAADPRRPFRGHKTTADLIELANISDPVVVKHLSSIEGGCSESCDLFTCEEQKQ